MAWCARAWPALLLVPLLAGCSDAPGVESPDAAPTGTLAGVVVTAAIVPIPGAQVAVVGTDLENVTDGRGEFLIGPLEPGTYNLAVEADGYAGSVVAVVVEGAQDRVNVVLDAVATTVPYHEVLYLQAYIQCSYAQRVAGAVGGNFNCLGIAELLLGVKISNDIDRLPLTVQGGGFKGLMIEMVWQPQATMPNFSGMLRDPVGVGGGVGLESQYWSGVSRSPLVGMVLQGIENDGAYAGDVFHPDPDVMGEYEFLIAGMSDSTKPVDVAVALEQDLELFVSSFYNALPGADYGIVPK